jgi:hypothetical protein
MIDPGQAIAGWFGRGAALYAGVTMRTAFRQLIFGTALAIVGLSTSMAAPCLGIYERPAYTSRGHFCSFGQMIEDAYKPGHRIRCEEAEVDHLISLRQAWDSGVCGPNLQRLANDPKNLRLTYWRTNRAKGFLPPDQFARNLPAPVAKRVLQDASALMRVYGIKSREQAVAARMLAYATAPKGHVRVPASAIGPTVRNKLTKSRVGNRVVVFIGKKAIGYAVGAAVGVEVIMTCAWAADWLTSPSQDERMKQREAFFREILDGEND